VHVSTSSLKTVSAFRYICAVLPAKTQPKNWTNRCNAYPFNLLVSDKYSEVVDVEYSVCSVLQDLALPVIKLFFQIPAEKGSL